MQGGALCLHTDDGRCMVLRRVELEQDGVAEAVRALADCGSSTRDRRVCAALGLEDGGERVLDRYVPSAAERPGPVAGRRESSRATPTTATSAYSQPTTASTT